MLVLLASVAFAQESTLEGRAGIALRSSTDPDDNSITPGGAFDLRYNPNGGTIRLNVAEGIRPPSVLAREAALRLGVAGRQPRMSVSGGLELDLLQPSRGARVPASGLWFGAALWDPRLPRGWFFALFEEMRVELTYAIVTTNDRGSYGMSDFTVEPSAGDRVAPYINLTFLGAFEDPVFVDDTFVVGLRYNFGVGREASKPDDPR